MLTKYRLKKMETEAEKDYAWFHWRVAHEKGKGLEWALELLAWNSVFQKWTKAKTLRVAYWLCCMRKEDWGFNEST